MKYHKVGLILQTYTEDDWNEIEVYLKEKVHRIIYCCHYAPEEIVELKVKRNLANPEGL